TPGRRMSLAVRILETAGELAVRIDGVVAATWVQARDRVDDAALLGYREFGVGRCVERFAVVERRRVGVIACAVVGRVSSGERLIAFIRLRGHGHRGAVLTLCAILVGGDLARRGAGRHLSVGNAT